MKIQIVTLIGLLTLQYSLAQTSSLSGSVEKQVIVRGGKSDSIIISPHQTRVRIYSYSTREWSEYDTDSKGSFIINDIKKGRYLLQVDDPVVKTKNRIYVEVSKNGSNSINPIIVDRISKSVLVKKSGLDASDPQKGKWGGKTLSNERMVSAKIKPDTKKLNFYEVDIEVISTNSNKPLVSEVIFHLHPSFINSIMKVTPINGKARLKLTAWGAFTIGVETDGGTNKLELDLSKVMEAPQKFKNL